MIEFQRISGDEKIPADIENLYFGSFPEEERRPIESLREHAATDPFFFFFLLKNEGETIGFATLWRLPQANYVEHFAIFPSMRGRGYGEETVKALIDPEKLKSIGLNPTSPLVLEVELPESSDMAQRRIDFYKRCGMIAMEEFPYYQPPYAKHLEMVPMMLMTSSPLPDPESFVIMLHTLVYNQ